MTCNNCKCKSSTDTGVVVKVSPKGAKILKELCKNIELKRNELINKLKDKEVNNE